MMKTNFKKIVVGVLTLSFVIAPTVTFAKPERADLQGKAALKASALGIEARTEAELKVSANRDFCIRFTDSAAKLQTKLTENVAKIENGQTKNLSDISKKRNERDAKLQAKRTDSDASRQEAFAKLQAKGITEAQKAAIVTFEATIKAGIDARRAAINTAVSTYTTDFDKLVASRQAKVDVSVNTFKAAVQAAVAKAKADCAAQVDAKTVKVTFNTSMNAAKKQFQTDRESLDNIRSATEKLRKTRDEAIRKAILNFQTLALKARADLKLVLSQS